MESTEDNLLMWNFKPNWIWSNKQTVKVENLLINGYKWKVWNYRRWTSKTRWFLKKYNINLIITFDQLDFIVPPNFWDIAIIPLIDFAKSNSYFKIYPKLFIRRDLFEKLSNITNKNSLKDINSINLEWNKDEIFGFFFKIVFAYSRDEFFKIMKIYNGKNSEIWLQPIKKEINKRYNQVPLEKKYLYPLIDTFFGKYAYGGYDKFKKEKFGYTYDWFYK